MVLLPQSVPFPLVVVLVVFAPVTPAYMGLVRAAPVSASRFIRNSF